MSEELERMRIMHLVNSMDTIGNGITNVATDLAVAQAEAGHDVLLLSRPGDLWDLVRAAGGRTSAVDFSARGGGLIRTVLELRRSMRRFRPDVVHCHTIAPTVLARACGAGTGALVVATIHNEYQRGVQLMRAAHHLFGVSEAVTAAIRARGRSDRRCSTVINGPIGSRRLSASYTPAGGSTGAIVFCGSLTRRKGIDLLIDAFGRVAPAFPDVRLVLVGSTDWDEVPGLIARSGAGERIERVGFQPDPRPFVEPAAVFVLPSRHDPMPLVVAEAMALGVPVVGSDVDGIPEALGHGDAGVVVPAEDPAALAAAISSVLADPARARALGTAGRARAASYTVGRMSRDYESEYSRLLGARRA